MNPIKIEQIQIIEVSDKRGSDNRGSTTNSVPYLG